MAACSSVRYIDMGDGTLGVWDNGFVCMFFGTSRPKGDTLIRHTVLHHSGRVDTGRFSPGLQCTAQVIVEPMVCGG
jgi:hypothetical protein